MRVIIFGSRNLTWKHFDVIRKCASHSLLEENVSLPEFVRRWTTPSNTLTPEEQEHVWRMAPRDATITLLNGDGPPGKERGAIGADKLATFAAMNAWWEYTGRRIRWFKPEEDPEYKAGTVTWAQAAARRDVAMAEARPDRAYCVHTDLDRSKGSIITAEALRNRGIPFWYVRVAASGDVLSVEER